MINNLSVFLLFATSFLLGCNHAFSFVSSNHHRQHQSRVTLRLSSTSTFGPAIQDAQSTHDLLSISLWLPTDDNLLPHIRSQHIHHEKRQRWAAQWLTRFMELHPSGEDASIFDEKAFVRTVLAVAMPYDDTTPPTRKETQAIRQSLVALHTLLRTNSKKGVATFCVDHKMIAGIQMLIQRAEQMALTIPLQEAVEVRWAARGLMASHHSLKNLALPQLEQRVARLPFDILPCGVTDLQSVSAWQQDIPFQFDTIITRTGTNVPERRGTAWVAQEGIGALAYSGKLMAPHPLPASVASVMRQVEQAMGRTDDSFFDCALCNWYPYGESACKFHTDPEHGAFIEYYGAVSSLRHLLLCVASHTVFRYNVGSSDLCCGSGRCSAVCLSSDSNILGRLGS
jgi:hypothetical protein